MNTNILNYSTGVVKSNILIISEENDGSTDEVLKWIEYFGSDYTRINDTTELEFSNIEISEKGVKTVLMKDKQKIVLEDFNAYWYRRGRLNIKVPSTIPKGISSDLRSSITQSINYEYDYLNRFIYDYFEKKHSRCIGSIYNNRTNKLTNLIKAKSVGLKVPRSNIISSKSQMRDLIKKYNTVLVKPINQLGFFFQDEKVKTTGLSAIVKAKDLNEFPEIFPVTLIQEYIEKYIELRIFFLNGKCFTEAIFSQWDEKTKVDFRNYNWEKPNRNSPFKLPKKIEKKIKELMEILKMNSGSLDMIYTIDNEYVFLEVNPIGQFWQVSYPCNFNLEKKIASYLCYQN